MNLVIDIGNTRCKWAIFDKRNLIVQDTAKTFDLHLLGQIIASHEGIDQAILSSVREFPKECRDTLAEHTDYFIELTHQTPTPIVNRYKTPQTLGLDRLAAAVGASISFPGTPLLVIDAGTAITIDFVSASNEFMGGNISPGIETRFRALNHFTGQLPLVDLKSEFVGLGVDTISAIRAGVQKGVIFEIESYIKEYKEKYTELTTVLTGGHCQFIAQHLQAPVQLIDDLTLKGLLEILLFNAG
ncbi:type III pantothenate kinase [Mangrovibacterium lignilyticum]|uniref:type III pantothenate kinase n=1 Tax=Mangrovibacterium lignilyticum TaxID=2668052 RepID=UPI0013D5A7F9|nr:type III pantothenate kinase [Mangrovibacterium lignilyticum]